MIEKNNDIGNPKEDIISVKETRQRLKEKLHTRSDCVVQMPTVLIPYIDKLNLKYPVEFFIDNKQSTLRCDIDHESKKYIIFGKEDFFQNSKENLSLFVHELCHCILGEKIDPLFITTYFEKEDDSKDLSKRIKNVYYCTRFVDIWVDDEMSKMDRNLINKSIKDVYEQALQGVEYAKEAFNNIELLTALALSIAERERYKIKIKSINRLEKTLMDKLPKDVKHNLSILKKFFLSCPKFDGRQLDQCLQVYEKKINEFANIAGFSIQVEFVEGQSSEIPHVLHVKWIR